MSSMVIRWLWEILRAVIFNSDDSIFILIFTRKNEYPEHHTFGLMILLFRIRLKLNNKIKC